LTEGDGLDWARSKLGPYYQEPWTPEAAASRMRTAWEAAHPPPVIVSAEEAIEQARATLSRPHQEALPHA
jgi:hypothetical protein